MHNQNWKWTANIKITVRDLDDKILEVTEFHNLITTVGVNMMRDFLDGLADGKVKYLGVGTDATPPVVGGTQLGTEVFRKAITSNSKPGIGQYKTITYLAPADAVVNIRELGWFCGAGALASPNYNTGIMISRVLYSRDKTNLESIQIERCDCITGV